MSPSGRVSRHVVVVGAGGNIGSHLVAHLARINVIEHVSLIDPDVYETTNVARQDIRPRDVGQKKVVVQARRLRELSSSLRVTALAEPVENVPLGRLRAELVLACLDSRRARQSVNQAALFLGTPWIDAGVSGENLLAGITVYEPTKGGPCLECGWSEDDYAALDADYPCSGAGGSPAPTDAPSSLGALAASLQAIECEKRLAKDPDALPPGTRVLVDARHAKHLVTTYRRNPACRIAAHDPRPVEPTDSTAELTLGEAFGLGRFRFDSARLEVEGKSFVRVLACARCHARRSVLRLVSRVSGLRRKCSSCGGEMTATGYDTVDSLALRELSSRELQRKLAALGIRGGEILSIADARRHRHFVLR